MADVLNTANGKWSISGTTASYKVGSAVVAKITGLASGLTADNLNGSDYITVTAGTSDGAGTIKLKAAALGTSAKTVLTLSNGGSYKLDLDGGDTLVIGNVKLSTSSGKATLTGDVTTAGHMLTDDKTIIYSTTKTGVTLATVSGLVSSVPSGALSESSGVVTLTADAFNKKKVTISSGYGYTLGLSTSAVGYTAATDTASAHIGGVTGTAAWSVSGTTATYKQTKTAQYDLASDSKSVTYTAAKTATLATIKGLAKGLTVSNGAISGISVTASTFENDALKTAGSIELSANVLGTSKVTLTAGKTLDGIADDYNLTLASAVPGQSGSAPSNENVWTVSGTTAIYKTVTPTHYLLDSTTKKSVSYEKQKDVEKLATVKGLAKGLTADGTGTAATLKKDSTAVVTFDSTATTQIKLAEGALNQTNVTVTNHKDGTTYTLALNSVTAPTITPTWSVSGTTATLKGTVTAGYEASTDASKITYTKATATGKYATLATVKGLATGLTVTDGTETVDSRTVDKDTISGITLATAKDTDGKYTITLGSGVLGTKAITLSGSDYKLALASGVPGQGGSAPDAADVWRLSGTTATYKNVTPEYYTLDNDTTSTTYLKKVTYTPEADTTGGTIATVTGLKAGLTADDDGIYADTTQVLSSDASSSKDGSTSDKAITITLKKGALTTGDVTLTPGTGKYANLAVYDQAAATAASDSTTTQVVAEPSLTADTLTWATEDVAASGSTPASTTVIIRSGAQEGWTLNDAKDTITYAPASTATDVATITGLKAGLAANEEHGIFATATEAEDASSDSTLITLNSKAITLTADVLGKQGIAVTGDYGYTFATVENLVLASNGTAPTATDMWVMGSGSAAGTAEYKSMVPKYFKYYNDGATGSTDDTTKLVYVAQEASTASGALKATLTGLKTDLVASSDGQSIKDADETADVVTLASKAVTINSSALDSKTVTITGTGYTLEEGTDIANSEATYDLTYNATAGTATLKKGTSEGYTLNSTSTALEYTAYIASDGASATTVASITGLAQGLEEELVVNGTDGTGTDAYITHTDTGTKTITLAPAVLGTLSAGITLNNDSEYILALSNGNISAQTDTGWTVTSVPAPTGGVSTTTATLYEHKTAAYAVASGSKAINYTAAANTSTKLAEITGLAYGLSASTVDQQIDGITVDSDKNIKLTADVLTLSDLTLTNEGSNSYFFSLQQDPAQDDFVPDPADTTNTWSITSGTLTYKVTTPNSYTVDTAKTAITFTPEMVDTTTITGLKSSLNRVGGTVTVTPGSTDAVEIIDGLTLTPPVAGTAAVTDGSGSITTPAVDPTPGTFNIGSAVLGKKDINIVNDDGNADSVTGDFDYNIALASDVTNKADLNAPVWNKTNKTTTATYTQTFNKGYTQTDDENIIYASKKTKKTYATLTGLNKDVVANADGSINGITIASASVTVSSSTGGTDSVVGGEVITLSDKSLFTTTNVALGKTDNYYLAVADGLATQNADLHWTYASGTAQLVTGTTEGWQIKVTDKSGTKTYDNKTIVYTKADETSTGYVKAKITGLNKSLEINDDGTIDGLEFNEAPSGGTGTIYVGADAVEGITGKVELTGAGTSYVLAYGDDITLPAAEDPEWVVSKGTATYQYDISEGWNLTDTSLTYQAAKTMPLAVITGLNSTLEAAGEDIAVTTDGHKIKEDGTDYEAADDTGIITLSANALSGSKKVSFKTNTGSKYKFAFGDDVYVEATTGTYAQDAQLEDEWKDQDGWVTNGTTANYITGYDKDHYKFDNTGAIVLGTSQKGTTVASVKNIKKDSTITDQNGLITLTSANLDGKTVTLTSTVAGYALALDAGEIGNGDIVESTYINKKWATSGNKANLTGTLTAGYKTSADGKTITYTAKDTANKAIATVNGVKSNASIKDNVSGTVITLNKAQLDGKAVTVTNSMPEYEKYTLALGDDVAAPVIESAEWAVKSDTATLTGKIKTAGYTVAPDAQSIAYTAQTTGTKVATLATIKGINQPIETTLPDLLKTETNTAVATNALGTITLRNELLSDSVTVDGKNLFAFSFADDFSNRTINGSTASDKLTIAGTGVSVSAGKGNDVIDFTSAGGNTLVYASGDGDDAVTNFQESDVIYSNKVEIKGDNIKTVAENDTDSNGTIDSLDVAVTIGKNTITLDNYSGSTLTVTDKNSTTTYEPQEINPFWTESTTASDVLLADNNYSANAAALSDIVEPFKASYTPYDFDGGLDPFKQDSFAPAVTYNGTDKK